MGGLDWLRAWVFSLIFLGWTLCETRKATKAEYQPYIVSLHDQFDVYHYIPDNRNTVINFVGDFVIKNIGRTPASNIQVTATIKYKARNYGERKDFHEKGVIDSFMKRCVLAIFALNLLCAPISYAQDNPAPSQKTTKSSPAQNSKTPAPAAKTEPQNNESKKDLKPIIPADNPSIDERMAKIAQKANDFAEIQMWIALVGLVFIAITTALAWGAWWAGRRAAIATEKQMMSVQRPYLIVEIISKNFKRFDLKQEYLGVHYRVRNIGGSPAFIELFSESLRFELHGENNKSIIEDLGGSNPHILNVGESYEHMARVKTTGDMFKKRIEAGYSLWITVNISYIDRFNTRQNMYFRQVYYPHSDSFRINSLPRTVEVPFVRKNPSLVWHRRLRYRVYLASRPIRKACHDFYRIFVKGKKFEWWQEEDMREYREREKEIKERQEKIRHQYFS